MRALLPALLALPELVAASAIPADTQFPLQPHPSSHGRKLKGRFLHITGDYGLTKIHRLSNPSDRHPPGPLLQSLLFH